MDENSKSYQSFYDSLQAMISAVDSRGKIAEASTAAGLNSRLVENLNRTALEPSVLEAYVRYSCEVAYLTENNLKIEILPAFESILAKTCYNPPQTLVEKLDMGSKVQTCELTEKSMIDACREVVVALATYGVQIRALLDTAEPIQTLFGKDTGKIRYDSSVRIDAKHFTLKMQRVLNKHPILGNYSLATEAHGLPSNDTENDQ